VFKRHRRRGAAAARHRRLIRCGTPGRGIIRSYLDNEIDGNTTDNTGILTVVPKHWRALRAARSLRGLDFQESADDIGSCWIGGGCGGKTRAK